MSIALFRSVILVIAFCAVTGCQDTDLTSTSKYADVIGGEYRTKTDLYAIGVYRANDDRVVNRVSVSTVRQTGPEVAFVVPIPIGHAVRVLKVRKRFKPFDNGIEFIVALDGLNLASGVNVFIPMYRYFQSSDGFPDSNRFERVRQPEQ